MKIHLPIFEDHHRALYERVSQLTSLRLKHLASSELEDINASAEEYIALLGQESLFDPCIGRALEGETPRPDLRSIAIIRHKLAAASPLADAVYAAQSQGMYPIALAGTEDQRAIFLPQLASGQHLVSLALLDGIQGISEVQKLDNNAYLLSGSKAMVPLATVANQFIVLAKHKENSKQSYSLFIVQAKDTKITPQSFISRTPLGRIQFHKVLLDNEQRIGEEGQGLIILQALMDLFRVPMAAAIVSIGLNVLSRGHEELNKSGVDGLALKDHSACVEELSRCYAELDACQSMIQQTLFERDYLQTRFSLESSAVRELAESAALKACTIISQRIGVRGLKPSAPWEHLSATIRSFRLESDFFFNSKTALRHSYLSQQ